KYSWVTIIPLSFVASTTLVAGYQSIRDIFWPLTQKTETALQGYIDTSLTALIMTAAVIILVDSVRKWIGGRKPPELTPEAALADPIYVEFVTAYVPDEEEWERPPFRRRKTKK